MIEKCEVCRSAPYTARVLVASKDPEITGLLTARHHESGSVRSGSTLPGVAMCDRCADATVDLFDWCAELPAVDLLGITSTVLTALCRRHTGYPLN